jgi:TIR domain
MGYTPFQHDIFLSYARADDEGENWISQFEAQLRIALRHRGSKDITLWRDTRDLKGHQDIDSTIKEALDSTALFLALNSILYPKSDYCRSELQYFLGKTDGDGIGRKIGTSNRWFNILQYNIPYDQWLRELADVPAYHFHDTTPESGKKGDRLQPGTPLFKSRMNDLADQLIGMLEHINPAVLPHRREPEKPLEIRRPDRFAVYIADVFDDLLPLQACLVEGLERQDIQVMTSQPPEGQAARISHAPTDAIAAADLSIHLINRNSDTVAQQQLELGIAHARKAIIWVPTDWNLTSERSIPQARVITMLQSDAEKAERCRVIREPRRDACRVLLDEVATLHEPWTRERKSSFSPMFFDIHPKDHSAAEDVFAYLEERQIVPLTTRGADPSDPAQMSAFRQKLLQARALVVFFGSVDQRWVEKRLIKAFQVVANAGHGPKVWGVYEAPPPENHKGPFELDIPLTLEWMNHANGFEFGAV